MRGRLAAVVLAACGTAGCGAAEQDAAPAAQTVASAAPLAFTEVTQAAGLADFRHATGAFGEQWFPETMGSGGGFVDYDGDGWADVVLAGGGTWPDRAAPVSAVRLYRNAGDGTFHDVTAEAGLADHYGYSQGILAADYDNDGDADLFVTDLGRNLLFRNDGGTFTEVAAPAGVDGSDVWSTAALFFDADRDGWLDLFVGNYVEWSPERNLKGIIDNGIYSYSTPHSYTGAAGRFYRNNGDGTFTERTGQAGFDPAPAKTLGLAETDVNRDGWPDLIVTNDTEPDLLYVNDGDGTFTERGLLGGMGYDENGVARAGMGVDAGVVDSTGEVTLFVGNFSKEMISVFRHSGNGLFIDRAAVSKIGRASLLTLTFGLFLFDVDLDGDLDLFAANGHVQPEVEQTREGIAYREPSHLFLNDGAGTFTDVAPTLGTPLTDPLVARAAAYADYDRDGDLDVLVTENGGPVHLWRNELLEAEARTAANFFRLHLEGRASNRDGLGTWVVAVADGRRMERRIRSGGSYLAQSERAATFGLGMAGQVDTLVVEWPSGRRDAFVGVPANRELLLVEGAETLVPLPGPGGQALADRSGGGSP